MSKIKNLKELIDEGSVNLNVIYRAYERESDIPVFYNDETKCFENIRHNRFITSEKFDILYLMPNVKLENDEEVEMTLNIKITQLHKKGVWDKYCSWRGFDTYSLEKIEENGEQHQVISIPVAKAKEWGLI